MWIGCHICQQYNFVGKLLGPKGQTLKALQEQTGCKMAIMGRGSMRDKDKVQYNFFKEYSIVYIPFFTTDWATGLLWHVWKSSSCKSGDHIGSFGWVHSF